jgi:hypothetical protein
MLNFYWLFGYYDKFTADFNQLKNCFEFNCFKDFHDQLILQQSKIASYRYSKEFLETVYTKETFLQVQSILEERIIKYPDDPDWIRHKEILVIGEILETMMDAVPSLKEFYTDDSFHFEQILGGLTVVFDISNKYFEAIKFTARSKFSVKIDTFISGQVHMHCSSCPAVIKMFSIFDLANSISFECKSFNR